jgi:hypothetical protein
MAPLPTKRHVVISFFKGFGNNKLGIDILGPGNFMDRRAVDGVRMDLLWRMRHKQRITRAPLGAAIPRFPADAIGVPGLSKEEMETERREKKRKAKRVPYL